MNPWALAAVLAAAVMHATWNLAAKRAAASRHLVFLYSTASAVIWLPVTLWVLLVDRQDFTWVHWMALTLSGLLHLGYAVVLQAGYRASDLSVVYPIARGSGPLLSFLIAALLLGEKITVFSAVAVIALVAGIMLVAGLLNRGHEALRTGVAWGLATGLFISAYTIGDGWAVKILGISPLLAYLPGEYIRIAALAPSGFNDRARLFEEAATFWPSILTIGVLSPLGYILVLYAMRTAPIGHVAAIRELGTMLGAYFGMRVLGEYFNWQRLIGALLILGGVVTLAMTA